MRIALVSSWSMAREVTGLLTPMQPLRCQTDPYSFTHLDARSPTSGWLLIMSLWPVSQHQRRDVSIGANLAPLQGGKNWAPVAHMNDLPISQLSRGGPLIFCKVRFAR